MKWRYHALLLLITVHTTLLVLLEQTSLLKVPAGLSLNVLHETLFTYIWQVLHLRWLKADGDGKTGNHL